MSGQKKKKKELFTKKVKDLYKSVIRFYQKHMWIQKKNKLFTKKKFFFLETQANYSDMCKMKRKKM